MKINSNNLFTVEKAKKLLQDLPSNNFDSITYEETKITFLYKDDLTYLITSDSEDSSSLIRKIANKIASKVPSSEQAIHEFIDSKQFDQLIQRKIKSETAFLPNRLLRNRFSSSRSALLSIIGGLGFLYAVYYVNRFRSSFLPFTFTLPFSNFLNAFLLLITFSICIGIVTGLLTGKTFESLFGAYFTFSLLFLIPFLYSLDFLDVLQVIMDPLHVLIDSLSVFYMRFYQDFPSYNGYTPLLTALTFPFSGALLGVGIGLSLHKDHLVPPQLPFKKNTELLDPVERRKNFFEIVGKTTKVMAQVAKSPNSKAKIQKINENAYQAVTISKQLLKQLRKNKVRNSLGLEADINEKAKAIYQGSKTIVATAKVDDVKRAMTKISEFFPEGYPYYYSE